MGQPPNIKHNYRRRTTSWEHLQNQLLEYVANISDYTMKRNIKIKILVIQQINQTKLTLYSYT